MSATYHVPLGMRGSTAVSHYRIQCDVQGYDVISPFITVVELSRTSKWPLNRLKPYVGNILKFNDLKQVERPDSGSWRPGAGDQCADLHAKPYLDAHPHLDERVAHLPDEDEEKELPSLDLGGFVAPSAVSPVL